MDRVTRKVNKQVEDTGIGKIRLDTEVIFYFTICLIFSLSMNYTKCSTKVVTKCIEFSRIV